MTARSVGFWLLAASSGALFAGRGGAENTPSTEKLGKTIDQVVFQQTSGKTMALRDIKDKKAIVVVFLSFECPVCRNYAQPLSGLAKQYRDRGVAFFGVSTNQEESAEQLAKNAAELRIGFAVCKDEKLAIADAFRAKITPEVFVLDDRHVLRYRGRIDDGYQARLKRSWQVTQHDLRTALDELLAGKPLSRSATQAVGCPIARSQGVRNQKSSVTFYRDVLPILQNHCQTCHRPGEVGPFSLMTYRQAVTWAEDMKGYTQKRKMPPWKPVEGPAFHNERKMSERDIATLAAWVDDGTPKGDAHDSPPPRKFVQGWQSGQPDLVLTVGEDFQLGPSGNDLFRCFVLPTHLTEDQYVTKVEVRPGNPRVVHHSLVFIDTQGKGRELEKKEQNRPKRETEIDLGPGYTSAMGVGFRAQGALGGWAPGQMPRQLPEGTAYFLPKGSDVVVQLHYHRNGRLEKDRTAIGLYFSKKPVAKRFQGLVIAGRFVYIPAGKDRFRVTGSTWVRQDCEIHSVMPHMHMLGREVKITLVPPDGPPRTLVAINDWDYNWQESYFFKEPIPVKDGTRFDIEAYYDNSSKNPNNPNRPPRLVLFGEQTTNEMCFGFLGATSDKPGRIRFEMRPRDGSRPGRAGTHDRAD